MFLRKNTHHEKKRRKVVRRRFGVVTKATVSAQNEDSDELESFDVEVSMESISLAPVESMACWKIIEE